MTYLHYTHTHSRGRSRSRERTPLTPLRNPYETQDTSPRLLVRHSSKHKLSEDSDDGYDDYPYPPNHKPSKPSRALTVRDQPSQLERYNIWSDDSRRNQDRHTSLHYHHNHNHNHNHTDGANYTEEEERDFHLRVHAKYSRTRSPSPPRHPRVWSGALFRRHDKFVDEAFETRERTRSPSQRRVSFWDDEKDDEGNDEEKWTKYHRVKRTHTEEWRPLTGWRRG